MYSRGLGLLSACRTLALYYFGYSPSSLCIHFLSAAEEEECNDTFPKCVTLDSLPCSCEYCAACSAPHLRYSCATNTNCNRLINFVIKYLFLVSPTLLRRPNGNRIHTLLAYPRQYQQQPGYGYRTESPGNYPQA